MKNPAAWIAAASFCILLAAAPSAAAQTKGKTARKLNRRNAKLELSGGWLRLTTSWRDAVDANIRRKLLSGLPTVVVSRVYLFGQNSKRAVALSVKTCRIVYDLWDEVFRIDLWQMQTSGSRVAVNVDGVLRHCGGARGLPLVRATSLDPRASYFVAVRVEVNPLDDKMLKRIRRWVARPRGAATVSTGDSLFGSFVGLFITQVPSADRAIAFRGPLFTMRSVAGLKPLRRPRP
ncbi:MAG: hypothetical protein VB934_07920 [Polyangiaceae bacterium]